MSKIKIAIVDDHLDYRKIIKKAVQGETDMILQFEARNGQDLMDQLMNNPPDIVLMDIRMPIMNGFEACLLIKETHPDVKIIALSKYDQEENIIEMIKYGAKSFIGKKNPMKELFKAIRIVHSGGAYMTDKAAAIVQSHLLGSIELEGEEAESAIHTLTNKFSNVELTILWYTAHLVPTKQIALKLFLSPNTVNNHQANLRKKLSLSGRGTLLQYALSIKHLLDQMKRILMIK